MMTDLSKYTSIVTLIVRYFSEGLTEEEKEKLDAWRSENSENEELFQKLTDDGVWKNKLVGLKETDRIGAYVKVMAKCDRRTNLRWLRRMTTIAASFLLPLVIGVWFVLREQQPRANRYVQDTGIKIVTDSIFPGEVKAELRLADGSTIRLDGKSCDTLPQQAGSRILVGNSGLKYAGAKAGKELVYNSLKIPRGGEYSLTLEDGTLVYLNSETELSYPVQFIGKERKVKLLGEAYFEVTPDAERPFIVETTHSKIEVLGTSFNLRSYAEERQVAATLVEGKVRFVADNRKKLNLAPGEQAVLDENGQLTKKEVDTYLYTAWKDGNFVFYKQTLEEVMRVIARWYDVEVHFIDASQRKVSFTGNVKRYDDFSKIVRMLEMTGNTEFLINGKNIFIKEK